MPVVPIQHLGMRMPEHGRIRLGVKTERAMKAIDKFRFTSPDRTAIEQLAQIYGGEVIAWSNPKASPPEQWQVISTSNDIRVFLPPNSLSIWYEQWSARGCMRRCDGESCDAVAEGALDSVPCLCAQEGAMSCRPYTRLNVILPEIKFGGVWRLESKGWNAAKELPAMEKMLHQLQAVGIVEGRLRLERRQTEGGSKKFVVPTLDIDASPLEILEGYGQPEALHPGGPADVPFHGPATRLVDIPELTAAIDVEPMIDGEYLREGTEG